MSNIQAAIGCGQLERIDELVRRKREIFAEYRKLLEVFSGVRMNAEPWGIVNGAWMPTVVFDSETGVTREKLQAVFTAENIDARVFFWPLSDLPMFEPVKSNTNARSIPGRAINLPSYNELNAEDITRICKTLNEAAQHS
jgi:perosamine synthetase